MLTKEIAIRRRQRGKKLSKKKFIKLLFKEMYGYQKLHHGSPCVIMIKMPK